MSSELLQVMKNAREEALHFQIEHSDPALVAALINYQAAQMITGKLDEINTRLSDINENVWRSMKQ